MSCVVERHLFQTVPALRNLTTAEQMPAVCPLLPVLWYSSPYTTRVTADTTPWCPPEEGLCSGQNGKAKPNWDVMGWGRAERSRAEQNRRLPVQLAEIRLAAQDGSDAVKLALVLFGKGTARVPGCDILLVAACPGVCGDPGLPSSSTVPLEGMGNGLQYHAPAAPFLLFSACWDGVALV